MGLMTSIPGMGQVPVQTAPTPAPAPQVTIDLRAHLAQEEQRLRAQAVAQNAAVTMDFATAWKTIEDSGRGYPMLGGAAAVQRAALMAQTIPAGAQLTGSGELGAIRMDDPAHVIQLGTELRAPVHVQRQDPVQLHQPVQTMPSTLPPDAPKSDPARAAVPMPGYPQFAPQTFAQPPVNVPAQQVQQYVQDNTVAPGTPSPAAPKRRGRPPKAQPVPGMQASTSAPQAWTPQSIPNGTQGVPFVQPAQAPEVDDSVELEVYVDCIPLGEYESLQPYVEHLLGVLCERFIPANGLKDVRCAPKESALAHGGWKGAVRAIIIEQPPRDAVYAIDTRGNGINEVVADAMLAVCVAKNARYARGVR